MDKLKRFIDINVPVTTCTLRCHYCYITQHRLFSQAVPEIRWTPDHIGKALSKERLGGICHFNMCGSGETLLQPALTGIVKAILEQGHYIMIVTNGTVTRRFDEMLSTYPIELRKRLGFKFSFHFLELKKRNLMDLFFNNIKKVRDAGCSFSLKLTPSDELIPYIDDVKAECMKRLGALCHVTVARDETDERFILLTKLTREEYIKVWSQFNSDLFDFKISVFGEKRNEFCYAGAWGGMLDLGSGLFRPCDKTLLRQNIFEDITKPINFHPIGKCNKAHCHNAHAWLTLGMIPTLDTPLYAQMRNRKNGEGQEWLQPEMKNILSQKLVTNNEVYTSSKERKETIKAEGLNALYRIAYRIKKTIDGIQHKN